MNGFYCNINKTYLISSGAFVLCILRRKVCHMVLELSKRKMYTEFRRPKCSKYWQAYIHTYVCMYIYGIHWTQRLILTYIQVKRRIYSQWYFKNERLISVLTPVSQFPEFMAPVNESKCARVVPVINAFAVTNTWNVMIYNEDACISIN